MTTTSVSVGIYMLTLWGISLLVKGRDPSFVDAAWGPGFALIALISAYQVGFSVRSLAVLFLVTTWGMRLGTYLYNRWRKHGPDERYVRLLNRVSVGGNRELSSLIFIFLLQGALMWTVSLPIQAAAIAPPSSLSIINYLGIALALGGMAIEAIADYQMAQFRSVPQNSDKVLNAGLWRFSRHPNYFGDAIMWWGIFFTAFDSYTRIWAVLGPITMTYLLRYLSGVPLLEKKLKHTKPGYHAYREETSAFFPMPKFGRSAEKIPPSADAPRAEGSAPVSDRG